MPYRTAASPESRQLALRNHPLGRALATGFGGSVVALIGCCLLPMARVIVPPFGADVMFSALGTVFCIAGITLVVIGARMERSRTLLALAKGKLAVTVLAHGEPATQHVLFVDDIEHVGVEHYEYGFGAQILMRGGRAIALGDTAASSRRHCESLAAQTHRFIRVRAT